MKNIEVVRHPGNPDGWQITEDGFPVQFLNANFFLDREHAEQIARSRRYITAKNEALARGVSRMEFDRQWIQSQQLLEDLI